MTTLQTCKVVAVSALRGLRPRPLPQAPPPLDAAMAGRAPARPAGAPGVPPVGIGLTFGKIPKGSMHEGALYVKAMTEGGPADLSRLVRAGDILVEVPCAPLPSRPCPRPTS
jgi:hypothetical protein